MISEAIANTGTAERLESAIGELLALQDMLSSDEIDPRILSDFRDALNRVRNTAWAAQQFVMARVSDEGPASVESFLAAERLRAAYQLCRSVREDLENKDIEFQKGQLSELSSVVTQLSEQLAKRL